MRPARRVNLGSKGSFTTHPGALHDALGIPESQPIGQKRIAAAEKSSNPRIRRMAISAKGLTSMGKG